MSVNPVSLRGRAEGLAKVIRTFPGSVEEAAVFAVGDAIVRHAGLQEIALHIELVGVDVGINVNVGVAADTAVDVGIAVDVSVDVPVGVAEAVEVPVGVSVEVAVEVAVDVSVEVAVFCGAGVGTGVFSVSPCAPHKKRNG